MTKISKSLFFLIYEVVGKNEDIIRSEKTKNKNGQIIFNYYLIEKEKRLNYE